MEALSWRQRRGSSPVARRGARQRAGLTPVSASNILSCKRETLHPKPTQKSLDSDHGIYGELASGCGAGRFDRGGRAGRFGSNVGCARGGERVNGVLRDAIDAVPGQSGVSPQVGAPPAESRSEWRVSVRWWISDDGIMRCRS
jgi:hypothetical protein